MNQKLTEKVDMYIVKNVKFKRHVSDILHWANLVISCDQGVLAMMTEPARKTSLEK